MQLWGKEKLFIYDIFEIILIETSLSYFRFLLFCPQFNACSYLVSERNSQQLKFFFVKKKKKLN